MKIKKLWREPLLHFLLIGAVIFLFYGLTRDVVNEASKRIVMSSGQIEQLVANFKRSRMRLPTQTEMTALIESQVREEVFYREALAMGLDQNDPQVRRRMRMKLEFILEDLSSQNVTDDKLIAFMQQQPDKFRKESKISFQQIYLNREKHKDMNGYAKQLLSSLKNGIAPEKTGDPTMVSYDFNLATQTEIARTFGERFAEDLITLAPGDWVGPVYSEYGGHLLKISERIESREPTLDEIRLVVEREYLAQQKKKQKDLAYQSLRKDYDITIEPIRVASLKTETKPIDTQK